MSPARDLSPRIMHALLPIPGKRDSDWRYAWIPVLGPLAGAPRRPGCTCSCTRRIEARA
ncbi:Glycerol uptake facilitator protein [Burkholderia gladioli]|nr:Glycerol uptake facilitator protein [Burkholderia gladioli]